MPDNVVSASAKGASILILLQIGSRAVTFALNQLLLRFLSPELLGMSVQLELFKIGVQYFSRESLRVAAVRRSDGGAQAAINLSYLAIMANIPLGFTFAHWYLSSMDTYTAVPYFAEALRVNQLAAFVELLMEPAYTAVQQNMLYKARAAAEGSSVILKTLTVFGLFYWANKQGINIGVLPFAAGELVNSFTLTAVYWAWTIPVARANNFSLFLSKMKSSPQIEYLFSLFSKPLLWLMGSLFFQTGIKWLLTEGDKLLIATLASLEDQGMYALSANYGGLIARMLFQPIETSARNLFAELCGAPPEESEEQNGDVSKTAAKSTATENVKAASQILVTLLRVYAVVSLLAFTVGPTLAPLLLRLVAGSRWSDSGAGEVLGTYCYYIPFLAINGVSEAFVAATASTKDLRNQSFWMGGNFVVFASSAWLSLRVWKLGAKGLVLANCVNMGLRIAFNLSFIRKFFKERGMVSNALLQGGVEADMDTQEFDVTQILPSMYAVAAAAVVPSILSRTEDVLPVLQRYGIMGELARIAGIGGTLAAVIHRAKVPEGLLDQVQILDLLNRVFMTLTSAFML
ncbi:Oligosaccharide translocation protein rft1 [Saxophila tyrrhenica]|uniref:Man(5)GlcNAc(2)-PP-dolichol translocation protein RFT1 n=1 Tax=Saxophila tyrrhenica TaxID=1690608 RepID=A0AAV9P6J1_9PEZI|nr:Oligosaccharide translocation protein rft1 [Saxophila tyrrhenica]